ncbi:MAG: prolyl oligopeptidase family serine peptidase [Clostridia bacterium]|nr:prolyl oligopeptidase family serine peptidase [Clostridia bacterium]
MENAENVMKKIPAKATQDEKAPCETVGRGPIVWYDFEGENMAGGIVRNMAGEGLNAVITGNPVTITSPTGADAIHFGQSEEVDYITIKNDPRLNFAIDDEFTIDFWYMLDEGATGWETLFSKGSKNNGWYGVWLGVNDEPTQGVCWGGDSRNRRIGSLYSRFTWHHITIIQKNRMIYTYLDGAKGRKVPSVNLRSDSDFYIGGASHSDGVKQFHGAIDEFKIYDYAWEDVSIEKSIYESKAYVYEYKNADGEGMSLPYRVYYPTGYEKSAEKFPLVLFLHGHGECGTDNKTQLQVFGRNLFLDEIAAMDNCLILAPQTICDGAINKYEWVASGSGKPGIHVWDSAAGGLKIREGNVEDIPHTIGMQAAEALLYEFIENNRVDKDRIYVGGISMGGCATWEILARNPELFAAAVPLCGSGILGSAASLKDINIWAFHGTGDKTVWTEGTVKMVEAIHAAGGNKIQYTPITENFGHSIWNPSYTAKNEAGETPAQWLLKQRKGK